MGNSGSAVAAPWLIPPRVDELCLDDGRRIMVVRDDELPGGTKRRALTPLMEAWTEDEFVFGGPAQGYAQLALAYSAADVGKRATFFIAERKQMHPLTVQAVSAGCRIVAVRAGRLNVVQARAKDYSRLVGARFLPLGFDIPEFRDRMAAVARALALEPRQVWCVAGSGALSRALQQAWPAAQHHAVQIGFPPDVGAAKHWQAPEPFADPAAIRPPIPSCANYDAKAWRFLVEHAADGALWWNVAA